MKFDFYTGARDMTGRGSEIGYGTGSGFSYEPYMTSESLNCGAQGVANGECDNNGQNYG